MKLLPLLLLGILLTSCATSYQSSGSTGGFYHNKVAENAYIIGFNGNGFTKSSRATDFALLRAAEIGKKLGYTHFVVEGSIDTSSREIINNGSTTTTSGNVYGYGNSASYSGTSTTTQNTVPVYKPGVEIGVLYSEGIPEGRHLEILVIDQIIQELTEKYDIQL